MSLPENSLTRKYTYTSDERKRARAALGKWLQYFENKKKNSAIISEENLLLTRNLHSSTINKYCSLTLKYKKSMRVRALRTNKSSGKFNFESATFRVHFQCAPSRTILIFLNHNIYANNDVTLIFSTILLIK